MANEVKWIKFNTNMFEQDHIDYIESMPQNDAILVIWCKLLCLAGKCNAGGYLFLNERMPYTEEMLVHKFRREPEVIQLAIQTFEKLGMIQVDENGIFVPYIAENHDQDKLAKMREKNRLRVQAYRDRERKKQALMGSSDNKGNGKCNVTGNDTETLRNEQGNADCNDVCNVTVTDDVTPCNALDIDIDIDKEEEGEEGGQYDPKVAELYRVYKEVFNQEPSFWQINELAEYCDDFTMDAEVLYLALRESKKNNAKSMKYVIKVLENWKNNQVKTVDDAKIVIREFENRQGGGKSDERRTPKKKSRNHEEIPEEECIYTKIRKQREQQEKENNISAD